MKRWYRHWFPGPFEVSAWVEPQDFRLGCMVVAEDGFHVVVWLGFIGGRLGRYPK